MFSGLFSSKRNIAVLGAGVAAVAFLAVFVFVEPLRDNPAARASASAEAGYAAAPSGAAALPDSAHADASLAAPDSGAAAAAGGLESLSIASHVSGDSVSSLTAPISGLSQQALQDSEVAEAAAAAPARRGVAVKRPAPAAAPLDVSEAKVKAAHEDGVAVLSADDAGAGGDAAAVQPVFAQAGNAALSGGGSHSGRLQPVRRELATEKKDLDSAGFANHAGDPKNEKITEEFLRNLAEDKLESGISTSAVKGVKPQLLPQTPVDVPAEDGGWTDFVPSADTRIIYVSSSQGLDENDGLSMVTPKRTLAAGYALLRDGYPDHLLLKRGDIWVDESFTGASAWNKSGRSADERMLLGAYGTGPRPEIRPAANTDGWKTRNSGNPLNHVAIVGISFVGNFNGQAIAGYAPVGIYWLRVGKDFLVEDNHIERFGNNLIVQGFPVMVDGVTVRRNVLWNPLRTDSGNTNFYIELAKGFVIEQNLFGQTAANEAAGNKLSHNLYQNETCFEDPRNRISENILYNGRSNLTARTSSHVYNNLSVRGGLNITLGYETTPMPPAFSGTADYNVVTESRNHWNGQALGWGLDARNITSVSVTNNLIFGSTDGSNHAGFSFSPRVDVAIFKGNVIYDWKDRNSSNNVSALVNFSSVNGEVGFTANRFYQPHENWIVKVFPGGNLDNVHFSGNSYHAAIARPFIRLGVTGGSYTGEQWVEAFDSGGSVSVNDIPDPTRSVGRYNAEVLGGDNSTEALMIRASRQSRQGWDRRLTADALNDWFRQGFGMQENP